MTSLIKDVVAHIRRQAEADLASHPHSAPVDRDYLAIVLAAADLSTEIEGLTMGQAYQIVGHLLAAHGDPSHWPSEAEEERVLNYLSAGDYQDSFLPWPSEAKEAS